MKQSDVVRCRSARFARALAVCAVVLTVALPCQFAFGWILDGTFDWRDVAGKDYTTPVRNQGSAGTCWAFAAIGALEAKLEISADNPDWNPDLSEQHLVSDPSGGGDISGGWPVDSLQFFQDTGVVTEAELPYAGEEAPSEGWPLAPGWEDRTYRITSYLENPGNTTNLLKVMLQLYGPLTTALTVGEDFWSPGDVEPDLPEWSWVDHAAVVVGFVDDPSLNAGGYWIIKNSWGIGWGDSGYGYSLYGFLERHAMFRAIDGDAYPVPEPATLGLLLIGGVALLRRRRATCP